MKIVRPVVLTDTGSFTRATTGTYYDSAGALQTAAINTPRFTYNPLNLAAGPYLLLEAAATNLVLNSATLVTQNVTVTAQQYTLAFNGTGTVTLSGAATDVVVGTGTTRKVFTFTATAGTLTLTVSGSCTLAQLETGSKATSYYATTGATATRAADVNSLMLVSNVPENDYPVWLVGTTYALNDKVLHPTNHKIYQSAAAGNVGHPPPDTAYWVDTGFDNRWRMFDQSVTSQTSQATNISVAIAPGQRIDSVVGLNCQAATVTVNVVDPIDGLVYSSSTPLTSYSGINNWFMYFYEPIIQLTEFINTDIPVAFPTATTTVSITSPSGTPAIGGLVIGLSKELGVTEMGAKISIIDYSVKTKDNFGNYTIVQRNFSKRADFSIKVDTTTVDSLQNLLASYRSIPIVYIGSNTTASQQFGSTIIYGYYKDFSIDIAYTTLSTCTMQIEGLN